MLRVFLCLSFVLFAGAESSHCMDDIGEKTQKSPSQLRHRHVKTSAKCEKEKQEEDKPEEIRNYDLIIAQTNANKFFKEFRVKINPYLKDDTVREAFDKYIRVVIEKDALAAKEYFKHLSLYGGILISTLHLYDETAQLCMLTDMSCVELGELYAESISNSALRSLKTFLPDLFLGN